MSLIMAGEATDAQIGAFIMGLRKQGENAQIVQRAPMSCARTPPRLPVPIKKR